MRNNYSELLKEIIEYSHEEANRLLNNYVEPEHLLLGVLRQEKNKAVEILKNLNVDINHLKTAIERKIKAKMGKWNESTLSENATVTKSTERILRMSMLESRGLKSDLTEPEHLLLAITKNAFDSTSIVLLEHEVIYASIFSKIVEDSDVVPRIRDKGYNLFEFPKDKYLDEEDDEDDNEDFPSDSKNNYAKDSVQADVKPDSQNKTLDTPALDNFGTDITRAASNGKLDPVIGREKEIERLAQILSRRKKNNPILIGEAGVGKSAIVEGLALRIVERKVPRVLLDKRIVSLDLASIVAGTKYRGQFEERVKAVINELSNNSHIILFIDEIHTIVGAGSAGGSMDAANMFKPALARGVIQCIGATTLDEYRKTIEKDGALERRFQKIIVEATTASETLQILENIKERYEEHHNVFYTPEALKACVSLTERYVNDRKFPDKAIDVLDEAGSRVHISNIVIPENIELFESQINEANINKMEAIKSQNFELAASFRDKEKLLLVELNAAKAKWDSELRVNREIVNEENVAEVVAMMTGIPVQRVAQAENAKLLEMAGSLKRKIIGQDEAVNKIVKAIQRNRVGLKDPNKPIGTFMFLGPTGVGKTHLAKTLAKFLFDSSDAIIRIDMSEYMEKINVSRLVGAPPGYVGYDEGGILTEKVRRKPYAVVLFDEIEKAHPDVFNLLLQILDEGHITDSQGRNVDFKNTILIMTSNVGTRQLKDFGRGIGFNTQGSSSSEKDFSRGVIQKALNKTFSPEFLNRIDDVIMFDQLSEVAILDIIDIELGLFYKRIEKLGYKLNVDQKAKEYIAKQGYDIQFGARPLKRAIQKYLEDEMAEMILQASITDGDIIDITYDKESDKITSNIIKA